MTTTTEIETLPKMYTVVIPWVPLMQATIWHPTEQFGVWSVLTRGAFKTRAEARAWAKANLKGAPYSIRAF